MVGDDGSMATRQLISTRLGVRLSVHVPCLESERCCPLLPYAASPSIRYVMGQSWHGRGSFQTKARLRGSCSGWKRRSNQPAGSMMDVFHDTVPVWLAPTIPGRSSSGPTRNGIGTRIGPRVPLLARPGKMQMQAQGSLLCGMPSCRDTRAIKEVGSRSGPSMRGGVLVPVLARLGSARVGLALAFKPRMQAVQISSCLSKDRGQRRHRVYFFFFFLVAETKALSGGCW